VTVQAVSKGPTNCPKPFFDSIPSPARLSDSSLWGFSGFPDLEPFGVGTDLGADFGFGFGHRIFYLFFIQKEADLQEFWLKNKKRNTTERSMKSLKAESFHQMAKKVRAFTCFVY